MPRRHAALPLIGFYARAALSLVMLNDRSRPLVATRIGGRLWLSKDALP
ncbi:MAG: hypothetical protein ACREJR_11570 [Candidatus Rokuibacteriota bacterium]